MCGITGIYNFRQRKPVDRRLLERMCRSIAHRGPDHQGIYTDDAAGVGFGHRRLSIIDLSSGNQPMSTSDEKLCIVFNGEIYNFPELKKELVAKGHNFRTLSDTEVILALYAEYGCQAFERLNGIFSLAIYDCACREIVLARDQFGVKPLYYYIDDCRLVFGSEIKAILCDPAVSREFDYDAFSSFLTFRYSPSPQTLFRSIRKLEPGYFLKIATDGSRTHQQYIRALPYTDRSITETEAIEEYQRLLDLSVKRQMISDVPVGLFLSGGVDSAAIGALMKNHGNGMLQTFTIGFPGQGDFNELDDARSSAAFIESDHTDLLIDQDEYIRFFINSFQHTEEPIAETTIPALYFVAKLAAQHLKVVLAGQGADEPMAGYARYIGENLISKYYRSLQLLPWRQLVQVLPRNEQLKRAAFASQFSTESARFLGIHTIFTPQQKDQLLRPEIRAKYHDANEKLLERLYSQTAALDESLSKLLYIDTRMNLSDDLLLFNDKMTMANSLEMRVPYLDVELVRFLETLPVKYKMNFRTGKLIHKKAVKKWLPDSIIRRKKRGFGTPMDLWLQTDLAEMVQSLLVAPDSACTRYFNLPFVEGLINSHRNREQNYMRHLFVLLSFEIWHRTFFEQQDPRNILALIGRR